MWGKIVSSIFCENILFTWKRHFLSRYHKEHHLGYTFSFTSNGTTFSGIFGKIPAGTNNDYYGKKNKWSVFCEKYISVYIPSRVVPVVKTIRVNNPTDGCIYNSINVSWRTIHMMVHRAMRYMATTRFNCLTHFVRSHPLA